MKHRGSISSREHVISENAWGVSFIWTFWTKVMGGRGQGHGTPPGRRMAGLVIPWMLSLQHLPVTLIATLSQTFSSLTTARHVDFSNANSRLIAVCVCWAGYIPGGSQKHGPVRRPTNSRGLLGSPYTQASLPATDLARC